MGGAKVGDIGNLIGILCLLNCGLGDSISLLVGARWDLVFL